MTVTLAATEKNSYREVLNCLAGMSIHRNYTFVSYSQHCIPSEVHASEVSQRYASIVMYLNRTLRTAIST